MLTALAGWALAFYMLGALVLLATIAAPANDGPLPTWLRERGPLQAPLTLLIVVFWPLYLLSLLLYFWIQELGK